MTDTVAAGALRVDAWPTASHVLALERASIHDFVASCSDLLAGRVLDVGAGRQPYRRIVEAAGGDYVPYDRVGFAGSVADGDVGDDAVFGQDWDALLVNQVLQYVPVYGETLPDGSAETPLLWLLQTFRMMLERRAGWLVLTGGTCWREIEPEDLSRLTVAGAAGLVERAGFRVVRCESRARVELPGGFAFSLGYGVLAQAQ